MTRKQDPNERRARIKERVRKLLALAESPYDAEAASALAKAKALLSREGLGSLDFGACAPGIVESRVAAGPVVGPWERRLLRCVLQATYTEALRVRGGEEEELIIVGREANVVTAKLLYDYLHETVKRRGDAFRESMDDIESFRIGMVDSIRRKLQERDQVSAASSAGREITVAIERERSKENADYIKARYGSASPSDDWYGVDPNSYGLGQGIGRKIPINRHVASSE